MTSGPKNTNFSSIIARRGFTLIELLAVIVVIAVLSAVIIPAVRNSRAKASATKCINNLRQLQAASLMYANEHGTYVPAVVNYSDSGGDSVDRRVNWFSNPDYLEYLDSKSRLHCPTYSDVSASDLEVGSAYSYGINITELPGGWSVVGERGLRVDQVKEPSRVMAFADAIDWQIADWGANRYVDDSTTAQHAIAYRHAGSANVVFYDGSVTSMTREDLRSNRSFWFPAE